MTRYYNRTYLKQIHLLTKQYGAPHSRFATNRKPCRRYRHIFFMDPDLTHPFRGRHSFTDRTQSIHCLTSCGYGPRTPTLPQRRDHQYFPSLWKTLTLEQKHHLIDKLRAAFNAFNSWFTNRFAVMDNEGIPRSEQFYWLFPQKIEWNAPLIPTRPNTPSSPSSDEELFHALTAHHDETSESPETDDPFSDESF